jgi:recombination protein RecR
MSGPLDPLIKAIARLPGLGPRSARRIAIHLLTKPEPSLTALIDALQNAKEQIINCSTCGNLDTLDPCRICQDDTRVQNKLCVVANVSDLWAVERTRAFKGQYHILGGVLSALDGIGPDDLTLGLLLERVQSGAYTEVILALNATVDGQSTAHYISDKIMDLVALAGDQDSGEDAITITRLAHGVPVGGELDYLDDGTITTALKSRSSV